MEKEDPRESIEELSTIFSTAKVPVDADQDKDNLAMNEDEVELDIGIFSKWHFHSFNSEYFFEMANNNFWLFLVHKDDIDIEVAAEKPKEQNMLGALNKKSLANKFNAMKGRKSKLVSNKAISGGKKKSRDNWNICLAT